MTVRRKNIFFEEFKFINLNYYKNKNYKEKDFYKILIQNMINSIIKVFF